MATRIAMPCAFLRKQEPRLLGARNLHLGSCFRRNTPKVEA